MNNSVVKIYYQTGTGNSLKIARDIGFKLGNYQLLSMPKLAKSRDTLIIEGGIIGFVFPVYFARPPVCVQEFIQNAEFRNTTYVFAVANGGGIIGRALKRFEKVLSKKEMLLDAGFLIRMPANYPSIAAVQWKTPEKLFGREVAKVDRIAEIVREQMPHKVETNLWPAGFVFSHLLSRDMYKRSKTYKLDWELWINDDCANCGTCERVCPAGNLKDSREWPTAPKKRHQCINCLACFHHCPKEAIKIVGEIEQMERYRNPDVNLLDNGDISQ
jgi:ferredoxin